MIARTEDCSRYSILGRPFLARRSPVDLRSKLHFDTGQLTETINITISSSINMASESTTTDGSNIAANNTSKNLPNFSHVPWPVRPRDGINYDFVATLYLIGSALALSFYLLETKILAPLLVENNDVDAAAANASDSTTSTEDSGEEGNAWTEFANGMEGMYFIFVPFVPCLLWSLVVRYFWMKETKKISLDKKDN